MFRFFFFFSICLFLKPCCLSTRDRRQKIPALNRVEGIKSARQIHSHERRHRLFTFQAKQSILKKWRGRENLVFSDSIVSQFSGGYKSTPHPQKREAQRCGLPECSSGDVSGLFEVWSSLFKFHQPVRVYSV